MSDSELDLLHPKMLGYGEPGTGKTTFMATAAEIMRTMMLNIDGGEMSLHGLNKRPIVKNIGNKFSDKGDLIKKTEELVWKCVVGQGEYKDIECIILDSVSELQNRDLEDLAIQDKVDDLGRDQYRKSTTRLRKVLRMLRDVPKVVLVTALPKVSRDEKGNVNSIYPALSRAAAESINGFMDAVWFFYKDELTGDHKIMTKKKGPTFAKGRGPLNQFPAILSGFTFPQVYAALQAAQTKEKQ